MADCLQILARVGGEELIRQIHHQAAQQAIFDYEELIFPLLLHTQTVPVYRFIFISIPPFSSNSNLNAVKTTFSQTCRRQSKKENFKLPYSQHL